MHCKSTSLHGLSSQGEEFKHLSILLDELLVSEMAVKSLPKRIFGNCGVKEFELCCLILTERFSCCLSYYLNTDHFGSPGKAVSNILMIPFPVLIPIIGKQQTFNHVIVVRKGDIIDFEAEQTLSLSIENMEYICGRNSTFLRNEFG